MLLYLVSVSRKYMYPDHLDTFFLRVSLKVSVSRSSRYFLPESTLKVSCI